MDLVLFGRQGSGKGTQGKYLAERYDLMTFVTGDELRKLAKEDSELGRKIKSIIDAGHLVPNEVVMEIIGNFMKHLPEGKNVIFDGIPRKKEQADSFNTLMEELGRTFKGLRIEINEETAIKRLTTRRMCGECKAIYPAYYKEAACEKCGGELAIRQDDSNMDSIRNRLDAYANETVPVIEQYEQEGKLVTVDGEPTIDEVNAETFSKLDPHFK
jgi:adenylate kinase